MPRYLITKQSGSIVLTATDAAGDPFDLTSLTDTTAYAKPFDTNETPVSLGTGTISGANNNIYTITWTSGTLPSGWSSYPDDREGAIVIYTVMDETGTADYFSWSTRFNVYDDSFTQTGATLPLVNLVFYDNLIYEYDNTTTDADPGSGKFRLNNTTLASVTEMYIDDLNKSGVDMQTFWQSLAAGSDIYISTATNQSNAAYFTVTSTPTNNVGYTTVPLTYVAEGTTQLTNGLYMSFAVSKIAGVTYADGESINDNNGNELLEFGVTASAVNHMKTTNAATGNDPSISATGGDTNIGLNIIPKGSSNVTIMDGNSNEVIKTATTASAVNEVTITNNATGSGPTISATGDDTNIDLNISSKAAGQIKLTGDLPNLELTTYSELTVSTGAVTATQIMHSIDTEGDAASDDLDTITKGTDNLILLRLENTGRITTLKHGTGNINLPGNTDLAMAANTVYFLAYSGSAWELVGSATAAAGGGNWPPTTDNDKTTNFTITSGEENENIVLTSSATADSTFTLDVSLLTALDSVMQIINESSYILKIVVSNTGTMTINTQYIDYYLSPGENITLGGDTSTNCRILAVGA